MWWRSCADEASLFCTEVSSGARPLRVLPGRLRVDSFDDSVEDGILVEIGGGVHTRFASNLNSLKCWLQPRTLPFKCLECIPSLETQVEGSRK